jgi:succinate dehydrogenase / fumarate reductase, flavoprotein subunit
MGMAMQNVQDQVLSADVLVVGGGIAGLTAAISAKEADPSVSVLVVDKATCGFGGKANKGGGNLAFLEPEDSLEEMLRFRVEKVGCHLEDQELLADFLAGTYVVLKRIEDWGCTVFHNPDGSYVYVRYWEGHPWRMALCEQDITESMLRRAKKLGVRFVDHVAVVDILKDGDRAAGAVGFSVIDGGFYTFRAKAVMLANGCQNYKLMRRWASGRGDGIAAAYRAGAEMRNAEFGSFINWVFADTKEVCQGAENVLYNAKGESISKVVRPVIEADLDSKEVVAWYKTILAGDGPVYANMAENQIAALSQKAFHSDGVATRPITTRFWTRTIGKAMAASKKPGPLQEVMPGFIGELSPVRVDRNMATTVPGLYAIGDIAASGCAWAGATPAPPGRMRGGGMMAAMWMAMQGASAAVKHAAAAGEPILEDAQVQYLRASMFAPLGRADGIEPQDMIRDLQDIMSPVGNAIYKSGPRLCAALERVLALKAQLPSLTAKDPHYLAACNEAAAMVNSAEMFFRASLARTESRGWHIREDHPQRDDGDWLKWVILKDGGPAGEGGAGEMKVWTEDVPMDRYPLKP